MRLLTETYRIKLSKDDKKLLSDLKRYGIKPTSFVRQAIREKIKKDMPSIIINEQKRLSRIKCPF